MSTEYMKPRAFAFLLSEATGNRSRNSVTIAAGAGVLDAGTVLGEITASGKFTASPNVEVVGIEGAETAAAVLGYGVDATDADVEVAVIDTDAEVKTSMIVFDSTVDDDTKTATKVAQLDARGIRVR